MDRIGELQIRANIGEPLGEADYNLGEALKLDVPEGDDMTQEEAAARGNNKEFEGDIMLANEDREIMENGSEEEKSALYEELRSASSIRRHKWKASKGMVNVPYTITNEFDKRERALIARGFQDYEKTACIRYNIGLTS